MIENIFVLIELGLRLIGYWDEFLNYADKKRLADAEKKNEAEGQAVDAGTTAKTPEEAYADQERVVDNKP